tara:strand:- start:55 stop:459 length:405 start_codon:yes stop_codon:yes gene_type:complete
MKNILKNIAAVVLGWLGGSIINMLLVQAGHSLFPMEGVDINDLDSLAAAMPNLSAEHFLFPFLAHAIGTFVGAFTAVKIAGSRHQSMAMIVGCIFLIGGIVAVVMFGGPLWFKALDLIVAYLPMAYLAHKVASK